MKMQWFYPVTLFCVFSIVRGAISFRKYCLNGSNPDVIPGKGKSSAGMLKLNDVGTTYDPGLNCSVTITADAGYRLLVSFTLISLRNSSLDALTVFYENYTRSAVLSGEAKCDNASCTSLMFDSGPNSESLIFHFVTANITVEEKYHGFKALYTAFDEVSKNGACKGSDRFLCVNSHCIASELVCDGNNNCGDLSDELGCHIPNIDTIYGVVVIVLAVAAVAVFVPAFCFIAVKGTMSIITFITVPNQATPLYSAVSNDETTLLTSSAADRSSSCYWGSSSCSLDRRHSYNSSGVTIQNMGEPSTSNAPQFRGSYHGETGMHVPS